MIHLRLARENPIVFLSDITQDNLYNGHYFTTPPQLQVIQKQPMRQESLANIEKRKKTLDSLVTAKNHLKDKLELRMKLFHVQYVHQLQDMLTLEGRHDDEEAEEGKKTQPVAMDTS